MNTPRTSTTTIIAAMRALARDIESPDGVAEYLKCTPRQVADRYAKIDGFPKPAGPRGMHPRYLAKEVVAWVEGQREKV